MFKNRKGLSEIVTTVLILLIVVAMVSALVVFIKPMVSSTGTGLNKAQYCTQTIFEPVSCKYTTPNLKTGVEVTVRRDSTPAEPDEIKLVFTQLNDQLAETSINPGSYPAADGMSTTSKYVNGNGIKAVQVKVMYNQTGTNQQVTCMSDKILCS